MWWCWRGFASKSFHKRNASLFKIQFPLQLIAKEKAPPESKFIFSTLAGGRGPNQNTKYITINDPPTKIRLPGGGGGITRFKF